ncbi:restriction endonuclease subunit S [Candidatus Chloroploca sp. M-50]|uniref:Restriction endonuclease subunit S n=1 Tax=Candidatus Chloroploca mongolica TaxID=2528176 RepID=A0ABS4D9X9_9CHLR|nr:restriction endonuclease subunit S [Candidatus Chloroploca mongolica]MBP1466237.1 restriction endonuclease subunit S [Candidatus Chloroploca mongolica]
MSTNGDLWKTVPIKTLYRGLYDGPHATPKLSDEGPIFLGIPNVREDGGLDLAKVRHIAEEDFPKWTKRILPQPGDIVFSYEATLHRYAIIPEGFRGCLGRRMALIRPNPGEVESRYLFYYFLSDRWHSTVARHILIGATVDRIPLTHFPQFEVTIPPPPIQRKIAAILSAYDDLIENNQRRIAILEEMAHNLYREWFVELRFPGHEHVRVVDGVPEGWEVTTLGGISDHVGGVIQTGPFGSQLHQSDYKSEGVPVVMPKNLVDGRISADGIARVGVEDAARLSRHRLRPGDIVYGRRGDIGRRALVTYREEGWLCGTGSLLLRLGQTVIDPVLLYLYLGKSEVATWISNKAIGATMPNLNTGILKSIVTVIPPRELQFQATMLLNPIFELIQTLNTKNINLRRTRDLLLPRLINGELDVAELAIAGVVE